MHFLLATPAHAPLLAPMNHRLIRDEGHSNPMTISQLEDRMRTFLTADGYEALLFYIQENDPTPLGYALYKQEPDHLYLRQFFIEPAHRRQGHGKRAISHLLQNVWQSQNLLRVSCLTHNPTGLAFWRSMGFNDYSLTLERTP